MKNTNYFQQIQIEPGLFYNLDLNSSYERDELKGFNEGYHLGQFAYFQKQEKGIYTAVRDPLGIGKLFYTETSNGEIHFSNKYVSLFPYKSKIYSVPAGLMVNIGTGGKRELIRSLYVQKKIDDSLNKDAFIKNEGNSIKNFREQINNRLEVIFKHLKLYEENGWTFIIALSGGLDSTVIATKASQHLKMPIACTLDLGKSEDSEKSSKIAKHLEINHLIFPTSEQQILK